MRTIRINCETSIIQEKQYKRINHAVFGRKQYKRNNDVVSERNSIKEKFMRFSKETA